MQPSARLPLAPEPAASTSQSSRIVLLENLTLLSDHLANQDMRGIIEDQDLFWALFCLTYEKANEQIQEISITFREGTPSVPWIHPERKDAQIDLATDNPELYREIREGVEALRQSISAASAQEQDFSLCMIDVERSFTFRIARDNNVIREGDLGDVRIYKPYFCKYIQPCLPALARALEITYADSQESRLYISFASRKEKHVMNCVSLSFIWNSHIHYVYPISPLKLQPASKIDESLYDMLKADLFCDFHLSANGGTLPVHANVLFARGGEMLQAALIAQMKEGLQREILFEQYNIGTLRAFVDYIYLGSDKFMEMFKKPDQKYMSNLTDLFVFAHTYQIPGLVDCCTNLISLFAKPAHVDTLRSLAERFGNTHLTKLCEHLSLDPRTVLLRA